jgi:signal transduction histidine kinase
VANLLDNAVHYNKPGGWVEIGIRSEPGEVVLLVANSGPVVPRTQVQRLVEPFHRLQRVADDGHHGLGLSIVHAIATAHDAALTVRAQLAGGLLVEVAFAELSPAREGLRAPGAATGYGANHEISALARDR